MNREIKFRALDNEYKKFTESFVAGNLLLALHDEGITSEDKVRFELSQFTGLNDKNGTPIFEGDIVSYNRGIGNWTGKRLTTIHQIIFTNEINAFVMKDGNGYIKLRKHWNYEYEVLGNIYENPELLSG